MPGNLTTYGVIGAGRQGPAIAYDLARHGNPGKILLADMDPVRASTQAKRVRSLAGGVAIEPVTLNARNPVQLKSFFEQCDVIVSALPTQLNPAIERFALDAGKHFCDLGTDSEWFWNEFRLHSSRAEHSGISIVPNCGLAPGMVNHLALYLIEQFTDCDEVKVYCGGLPQEPEPPLYYQLSFSISGLLDEYTGDTLVLRDGKIVRVPALEDQESIDLPPFGTLEAVHTSNGLGTAPFTLQGHLGTMEYKTLRYPGHWDRIRFLRDAGFLSRDVLVLGASVATAREVTEKVLDKAIRKSSVKDVVIVYARARGRTGDGSRTITATVIDYSDPQTGFSAMERMTGFCASIIAIAIAEGRVPRGIIPYDLSMSGHDFITDFCKRGFSLVLSE